MEFGHQHKFLDVSEYHIRVNFMQHLRATLSSIGVPDSLVSSVFDILAQLHKPLGWNQIRASLLKFGLDKQIVDRLAQFDVNHAVSSSADDPKMFHNQNVLPRLLALQENLKMLGVSNSISFDPLMVYNPNVFGHDLVFQVTRKVRSKYDVIAAGGRYESLLKRFRGPFDSRIDGLSAVGVNIAFSKFISNMAVHQAKFLEDKLPSTMCTKAETIVVCLGDSHALKNSKLSIVNELWGAGISADLALLDINSMQDDLLTLWRYDYTFAVILKPKAIKVLNLVSKTEQEGSVNLISAKIGTDSHVTRLKTKKGTRRYRSAGG